MVSRPLSIPSRTLQQALLELDSADVPFPIHVAEASKIIGFDADDVRELSKENHSLRSSFPPREDWVLRWLLKKLQSTSVDSQRARLEPKAWLLLQELLRRVPLSIAARLLSTHGFTTIVRETLECLVQAGKSGVLQAEGSQDACQGIQSEISDLDYSSSTMLESPSSHTLKRSRKRKRGDTVVIFQPDSTGLHERWCVDGGLLYEVLCCTLGQIIHLTEAHPGEIGGFASEHMRAVLRMCPDDVAKVLGSSMYMLSWRIEQRRTFYEHRSNKPPELFSLFLSPMVALWDLRSGAADNLAGQASNHAFSAHCLMSALHLLSQCEATKDDALVSTTTHVLQKLVSENVIMPARAAFLETIQPGNPLNGGGVALPVEGLFHPLQLECSRELENNILQGTMGPSTGAIAMLPMTFHLIIRSTSLDTNRRLTTGMSWLQYMFINFARCASTPVLALISPPLTFSLRVLKKMLEIALTSKLFLDASILENIVSQYSGIISEEPNKVDWELVGLCLKLDPTVFLMPSSSGEKGKIRPAEHGSYFLAPLLSSITSVGFRTPQEVPVLYRNILHDVLLPLVAAFAHARGLDRFIKHWQEQLCICGDSRRGSTADLTIWEDEELLHLVARLLEPSLTTGQIEEVFHATCVDLEKRFDFSADDVGAVGSVSSVIIECIVDGCTKEAVTDKLSRTAQMVYRKSLRVLQESPCRMTKLRWRLWRVTASIRSHWPGTSSPRKVSDPEPAAESRALEKALETLLNGTGPVWSAQGCMEGLQAFKFILSFAPNVHRADLERSLLPPEIETAIGWVTSCLEEQFEQIDPNRDPGWDGRAVTATSQDALLIGCATQLILSPKAISCCASNLRIEFFSVLSMCAWQQERFHPAPKPTTIRYPWLWQKLLHSQFLNEEASLASCLCKVQVTEYQKLTEKGSDGSSESRQWFGVKSLLNTSMETLERRQSALISNCTLQKLLEHHGTMSEQQVADYFTLLGRTVENPSKSLQLCTEPSALWSLAKVFGGSKTILNISATVSMRRLTDVALKHLISTASEERSAEYLRAFYDLLHEELSKTKSFLKIPGMSVLIGQAMSLFQRHLDLLSQILKHGNSTILDLRQTHFKILLKDLHRYEKEWNRTSHVPSNAEPWIFKLDIILDSLAEYADLLGASPRHTTLMWLDPLDEGVGRTLSEHVEGTRQSAPQDKVVPGMELLLAKIDKLNSSMAQRESIPPERLHQVIRLLVTLCTPLAKRFVLGNFKVSIDVLNPEGKADLLASLTGGDDHSIIPDARILLFHQVVASIENSNQEVRIVTDAISHIMAVLCDQLGRSEEFRNYFLTAQCLDLVLQMKPWAVSQWHIDALLCTIISLTLPSAPKLGKQYAGFVYTSLCRLYGIVLATHRTKIGGRYHLVVPALQGLMRCLFIPHGRNGGSAAILTLPPWLFGREPMLDATHAAGFARLMTTICDPTVSSITRSKTRSKRELNDDTKKARSIAGQYLPYVIMEYCQCQLKGRLLPAVKAALIPGLYAAFDVMSQDTMRTLNATMDSSSRTIFKALYDDYRRFGRWEGV